MLVREQDDELLRKVVAERVRALNLSGAEQYFHLLSSAADIRHEREALAIPLTAGETYFFRDSGLHALLLNSILPELLERRNTVRMLRIWCAACSTGEEAYSLAILLDELMADQSQWNIYILGTDINHSAIDKAQRGIYTEWSFRGMSDERRQRYFHRHKNTWVLDDAIRRRVSFLPGDLVADQFPDHASGLHEMDLILCRNTFIYMAPHVVSRIADKFTETLTEGGILITGHGELYAHHLGALRARVFPESIVYQKVIAPYCPPPQAPLTETLRPAPKRTAAAPSAIWKTSAPPPPPKQGVPEICKEMAGSEMHQAWQHANQGQRDQAAKSCEELIAKNPLVAEPHYLLALLTQERGDFAKAKELLKKVIYLDHSFVAAYLDLGDLYEREGDSMRAGKMRETARDLLKALPGDAQVKLYGASTVNAVLQYIEHLPSISK
ncbi:protein-glutamate O-methyltransferase [Ferrigenium kumadai]|uniref:Protein-glutamate O-methyltransferase n=1 Tax=Ferrigenium kumadai TaxID=1682490 RepID=A0AAN1T0I9_9PROT|nr:protein-glutamate O-methyltransferase [Ferrigenium kumadai]